MITKSNNLSCTNIYVPDIMAMHDKKCCRVPKSGTLNLQVVSDASHIGSNLLHDKKQSRAELIQHNRFSLENSLEIKVENHNIVKVFNSFFTSKLKFLSSKLAINSVVSL